MNTKNSISAELVQVDYDAVMAAIQTINDNLPFLITLSDDERRALPKMGDKTIAFVSKALEYAKLNPALIPAFMNLTEFEKDMALVEQLENIKRNINTVRGSIIATEMLAGSEAYQAALMFYQSTKMAMKMNLPGAKEIYEDLNKRFPRGKKQVPTTEG